MGDEDLETCFETLTQLVEAGWQLISIQYVSANRQTKQYLPVEAFDGKPMYQPIKQLKREWEAILSSQ